MTPCTLKQYQHQAYVPAAVIISSQMGDLTTRDFQQHNILVTLIQTRVTTLLT